MPELPGIGEPAERTPDSSLPSERRLVSVLFVDLENFTELAEALDPEDVRSLQSRYFEVARSAVSRYGGTIEKFIGDAVMAVWGAPTAHEDDGERAVRAALALVAEVGRLNGPVPGGWLAARAAVATGEAAVTLGVEGQGMVAGDLVNTAARLQAAATPGGVLVDEATRRIVGGAVTFDDEQALTLKGKSRSVPAWRATGLADTRGRGRGAGHSGSFVGRQVELEELIELYRRAVADRRSRLISVLGIAGIGKSRLIWEFEQHLDALPDPVALHIGRAPAYGEGITFAPLAEMVRRRARISEGTETEVARRQLATTLVELVPDEAERQWIEPRVATLLDPGSHVAYEREELFSAWRHFFERVSEWAPALLVFEDLQWADGALLDFIDHLATWSRGHPILIIAVARPELMDRRPTWGAGQRSFTAIHLERLDDDAMTALLTGLGPGMPEPAVRQILDRAGGVPLYGVEVVRMLIDRGQLVGRDGRFELLEGMDGIEIPETLHALVSARIDALPAAERRTILSAAALGRRFHPDALAAICGLEPREARERMASLVRHELLAVDDELRSPGQGQLSFVQDVVREVAYRTLSRQERRTLHLAAADHLESLHESDLVEAVAEHLVEAHRAAPNHLEAPAVAERAVGALREAARRALALHVPLRALTHIEQALELVADGATRAELWEEGALAARAVPRFDVAERLLRQLIGWSTENGERAGAARARAQLASLLLATERHGSALGDLEVALEGISDLASDPASAELSGQLARAYVLIGEDQKGLEWANRTLEVAEKLGPAAVAVDALITRGTAQMRLGNDGAGLADLRGAIAQAQVQELISAELRARNNLAWLVVADDPHVTIESARGGMELAARMGVGDMRLQFAEVACAVASDTGDSDWALVTLDDVRDQPQAPAHRIQFAASEAILRALQGDARAVKVLEALEPVDSDTEPQIMASIDFAAAWIAFLDHRFEDARRLAEGAAARSLGAEQHAAFALAARACLWLRDTERAATQLAAIGALRTRGRAIDAVTGNLQAGLSALIGRNDAAEAEYAAAADRLRDLDLPLQLGIGLLERAKFLTMDRSNLAEAIRVFERIGAGALLAEVREPTRSA
ncbi:MAG: adenylate/guanylate cyclase domain-containing protein [Chloroflexota bacterium]